MSNFTLNSCLCFGSKPKKQVGVDDNLVTIDGNIHFPDNFCSREFLDQMEKRRLAGLKRSLKTSSRKSRQSLSQRQDSTVLRSQNAVQVAAVLTENDYENESQLGQDDE